MFLKSIQLKLFTTKKKIVLNLEKFYTDKNIENFIFSFNDNFKKIIQETDLSITRAGASTLAELSISNIPFLAVPLPTSKDNHQLENANFYKKKIVVGFLIKINLRIMLSRFY